MSQPKQAIAKNAHTRIRKVSTVAMLFVGLAAAVLSWHGLTMLGEQAGFAHLSILLPLVIDGTMLVGALHVLHASLTGLSTRWGWGMTLVGVAVSTWGNVAGASTTGIASGIVHAIPALALATSVEATMRIIRHEIAVTNAATVLPVNDPAPLPPRGGGQPTTEAEKEKESAPKSTDALNPAPAPSSAPAAPTVQPAPPVRVPVHARTTAVVEKKVATQAPSRTHLRAVGQTPDGVPSDLEKLAAWVRKRKAAGQSDSAAQAFQAGMATSQSTAKRALARLRAEYAHALEPVVAERTGS